MRRSLGTVATLVAGLGAAGCAADAPSEQPEPTAIAGGAAQTRCAGCAWTQAISASTEHEDLRRSARVAVDDQGNVLVGGTFHGILHVGGVTLESAGGSDVFLARLSPAGEVIWVKRFGDAQTQELTGIAVDPAGNAIVTGVFNGALSFGGATLTGTYRAIFLAKLDPAGGAIWSKAFEGDEDSIQRSTAVAVDRAGNVLLAGNLEGTLDFRGLTVDHRGVFPFVVKLGADGAPRWAKSFKCSVDQEILFLGADRAGNVRLAGNAKHTCVDEIKLRGRAFQNILLGSIEAGGKLGWVQLAGSERDSSVAGMDVDRSGRMVVAARIEAPVEIGGLTIDVPPDEGGPYAVRLDAAGEGQWATRLPYEPAGVAVLRSGEAIVVGRADGDLAASRLGNDGALRWTFQAAEPGDQEAIGVAVDGPRRAIVLTASDGALDLGCGSVGSGSGPALVVGALDLREGCAE